MDHPPTAVTLSYCVTIRLGVAAGSCHVVLRRTGRGYNIGGNPTLIYFQVGKKHETVTSIGRKR